MYQVYIRHRSYTKQRVPCNILHHLSRRCTIISIYLTIYHHYFAHTQTCFYVCMYIFMYAARGGRRQLGGRWVCARAPAGLPVGCASSAPSRPDGDRSRPRARLTHTCVRNKPFEAGRIHAIRRLLSRTRYSPTPISMTHRLIDTYHTFALRSRFHAA